MPNTGTGDDARSKLSQSPPSGQLCLARPRRGERRDRSRRSWRSLRRCWRRPSGAAGGSRSVNTHWHPDHTGGNPADQGGDRRASSVRPPNAASRGSTVSLAEGDEWDRNPSGRVIGVPATRSATSPHLRRRPGRVRWRYAVRDGLRTAVRRHRRRRCTVARRLAALPDETPLYCAHEYTLSNARFAAHAEPDNRSDHPAACRRANVAGGGSRSTLADPTVAEEPCHQSLRSCFDLGTTRALLRKDKDSFRS